MKWAVFIAVLTGFVLGGTAVPAWAAEEDVLWQNLQKAALTTRTSNYQGLFVSQTGQQVRSVQMTHYYDGQTEFTRNIVLGHSARQVFGRDGALVVLNPQKNEKIIIEKRRGQNMFPVVLPDNLDLVRDNYNLRIQDVEVVAGQRAQSFELTPKDNLRYRHKVWIGTESNLLLKYEVYNKGNELMEGIEFNQVSLSSTVDVGLFQPKIEHHKHYVMGHEAPVKLSAPHPDGWTMGHLPVGYRKIEQVQRQMPGKLHPVTHMIFSDGLTFISLFVEPLVKGAEVKNGAKVIGNVSFCTVGNQGYQMTAVGAVPEAVVTQFAHAIKFIK